MGNWVIGEGIHCDRGRKKTNFERRIDNISLGHNESKDSLT